MQKGLKRVARFIGCLLLTVVMVAAGGLGYLSITEYRPNEIEELSIEGKTDQMIAIDEKITIMTWNLGYGALGDNADFFMDGGTSVMTADETRLNENLSNIIFQIEEVDPDIMLFQEIDRDSKRSYYIDETEMITEAIDDIEYTFASNFLVSYVPYPIPTIGKVDSGIMTVSKYAIASASRRSLYNPFSWPIRMANLKRCLNISRLPIDGSDQELVLINLHLEAFDDGEGKLIQTQMLKEVLDEEIAQGNYVIAGGDFNQTFTSADKSMWPIIEGTWQPGTLDISMFDDSLQFLMPNNAPSGRSLDQSYVDADKDQFQFYLIDGFIVSENVSVYHSEVLDLDFVSSDHNPVVIEVELIP